MVVARLVNSVFMFPSIGVSNLVSPHLDEGEGNGG